MQQLITTEEVLHLENLETFETYQVAKSIFDATVESESEYKWAIVRALTNIFLAGRIQGIREERLKNRG